MSVDVDLADEAATLALGARLATLPAGLLVTLQGDLGAGKTTLVRGWLRALGHAGAVKSPTYTLVEPYTVGGADIMHFDLYRLADEEELDGIGFRDYLASGASCLVEWPERAPGALRGAALAVSLAVSGDGRRARLEARTQWARQWLARTFGDHAGETELG